MTHLAFELRTSTPGSLIPALAERVEESGYRSLWVNHPPGEDGIGCLAAMASATARITLGTAVVPVSAVPPDAILRRIDETSLPPERLRLGIGSGRGPSRWTGWPTRSPTCASARPNATAAMPSWP